MTIYNVSHMFNISLFGHVLQQFEEGDSYFDAVKLSIVSSHTLIFTDSVKKVFYGV